MTEPKQDLNTNQLEGHYKKFVERQYIGSHDLMKDDGSHVPVTVVIDGVYRRQLFNPSSKQEESCLVASLEGKEKDFILNATNQSAIEAIAKTGLVQKWPGTKIKLVVEQVRAKGGEMVDGLRVKAA